jgi:hypothetical protein
MLSTYDNVIAMFAAILVLLALPVLDSSRIRGITFKPVAKLLFWIFIANFLTHHLKNEGAKHVETPFIEIGQICTFLYFAWFLFLIPAISIPENIIPVARSLHTTKGSLDTAASGSTSKPLYRRGNSVPVTSGSGRYSRVFKRNFSSAS